MPHSAAPSGGGQGGQGGRGGGGYTGFTGPGWDSLPPAGTRVPGSGQPGQPGYTPDRRLTSGGLAPQIEERARMMGGEFMDLFPQGIMPRMGEIPLIDVALQFQNRRAGMEDRRRGLDVLHRAYEGIGTSPDSVLSRELAVQAVDPVNAPWGTAEVERQTGAIRDRAATGAEDTRRRLAQSTAMRGIGGAGTAFQRAQMERGFGLDVAQQMADFKQKSTEFNRVAQQQAWDRYNALTTGIQDRKTALQQQIAQQYLDTEYGRMDLSGLLQKVRGGPQPIGVATRRSRSLGGWQTPGYGLTNAPGPNSLQDLLARWSTPVGGNV